MATAGDFMSREVSWCHMACPHCRGQRLARLELVRVTWQVPIGWLETHWRAVCTGCESVLTTWWLDGRSDPERPKNEAEKCFTKRP